METQDSKNEDYSDDMFKHSRSGKVMGGLIIVAIGVLLLIKQMGVVIFPYWLFTWPMILIAVGFYIGARHNFYGGGWFILLLVGGVFLTEEVYPSANISEYIWPIVIIVAGMFMIIRPKRKYYKWGRYKWEWKQYHKYGGIPPTGSSTSEDYLDSVSVFGGVHKIIMSKDFKGGDVVNIFGGAEINLSQADIKGSVRLEVVNIFGGAKIIVPANWEVRIKSVPIFGGVEDKRPPSAAQHNPDKVLVIDATSIFGGVEILNY